MKPSTFTAAVLALVPAAASAAECGKWYSSPCVCETDIRYCDEGENGATDDIKEQHPYWKAAGGYYRVTLYLSIRGLRPLTQAPDLLFSYYPSVGYQNFTFKGSRSYKHWYILSGPNPNVNCSVAVPVAASQSLNYDGKCGVNGHGLMGDTFATSSQERDGSMHEFGAYFEDQDGKHYFDEYKTEPADGMTLFSSAKGKRYMLTQIFSFIDDEKTRANSVQDIFRIDENKTSLYVSQRMVFEKISEDVFLTELQAKYEDLVIPASERAQLPMTKSCVNEPCPTQNEFCAFDPMCAASRYVEPDATVKAGPIAGIVVAAFVVLIGVLYLLHRKAMIDQAARNKKAFARRIAETIKLEGPGGEMTPEALAEEFKKIDNGCVDGSIDREELRAFLDSGKSGATLSEASFNALFAALDVDGDGKVSFMEFSAYLGSAQDDFKTLKKQKSVLDARGLDQYYMGVSKMISKRVIVEEDEEN